MVEQFMTRTYIGRAYNVYQRRLRLKAREKAHLNGEPVLHELLAEGVGCHCVLYVAGVMERAEVVWSLRYMLPDIDAFPRGVRV